MSKLAMTYVVAVQLDSTEAQPPMPGVLTRLTVVVKSGQIEALYTMDAGFIIIGQDMMLHVISVISFFMLQLIIGEIMYTGRIGILVVTSMPLRMVL
jgi:hypothetical protein